MSNKKSKTFISMKNYKEKAITLRGKKLSETVKAYQKGDERAAELLRQSFFPLVIKISHKECISNVFQEDAENVVWEVFYTLIKNYKGNKYNQIPGMLNMFLEHKVMRKLKKFCHKFDYEVCETEDLHLDCVELPDTTEQHTLKLYLEEALNKLDPIEKEVIELYFVEKLTIQQIADCFWFSYNTTRRIRDRALSKLRKNLK